VDSEVIFLVAVLTVGILSGATAAVVGFGIGSLMTPLLLTRFEPSMAIALVALPHLIATAVRFIRHRRNIDRRVLLRFGIPSAVGGIIGGFLSGVLRSEALVGVLGGLLVLTGIANLTNGFWRWHPGAMTAGITGWLSGVFGGLVGNQGGLRAAGLSAFNLEPRTHLATSTAVALLIDAGRTPFYLARSGGALWHLVVPIAAATIGCVAGTIAGERIFLRLSKETYRRVIGAAVLILGIWLLGTSLR
jgi:uncharacterized protein